MFSSAGFFCIIKHQTLENHTFDTEADQEVPYSH